MRKGPSGTKLTIKNFDIDLEKKIFIDLNSGKQGYFGTILNLCAYIFLSIGQIIRIKKPFTVMKQHGDKRGRKDSKGYPTCRLSNDDGKRLSSGSCRVNCLIWRALRGEIPKETEVDHFDEDPWNNDIDNLRLMSHGQNIAEHVRVRAYNHTKKNNIPVPSDKKISKPKPYKQEYLWEGKA